MISSFIGMFLGALVYDVFVKEPLNNFIEDKFKGY